MSKIPTSVTQKHFEIYIDPLLSKAKRGYVSKVPLFKIFNYILYWLHTGCQWYRLPIDPDYENPGQKECSYHAVYYHYRKWSKDGSLKKVWEASIQIMKQELELSHINLDGTHIIAKKGGEEVAYQGRKKSKTSNILPVLDGKGYVIGTIPVISGNHNDSFNLKIHLQDVFRDMKSLGLSINGSYFNADKAFDTKDSRKVCFNHGLIPNIPENQRNRKKNKRGRKRLFNQDVYKKRFTAERSFAWVDKFKRLLIRFERRSEYFMGSHYIAFAMINLRSLLA